MDGQQFLIVSWLDLLFVERVLLLVGKDVISVFHIFPYLVVECLRLLVPGLTLQE